MPQDLNTLEQLLARLGQAADGRDTVSLGTMVRAVGTRSFGPLLLVVGFILISPFSGIPGFPTAMGVFVLLIAVQLLLRREHFWLPQWLLRRSVQQGKVEKALKLLMRPARFIDRLLHPRLTVLLRGPSMHLIAAICLVFAFGMPFMELVPFSASGAGVVFTAFGLSLIAHDGFLALLAFATTLIVIGLVVSRFIA